MTHDDIPANSPDSINAPKELTRFLTAYRPANVTEENWALVADEAVQLVIRGGVPTRLRVEKDIQLLGAVIAHLVERGRPVTLEEALSDSTLLSFDSSLQVSAKTRENKRGIARRLQAVHRRVPWRAAKQPSTRRVAGLVAYAELSTLNRILGHASAKTDDSGATAFLTAVSAVRGARHTPAASINVEPETWAQARRFAAEYGWDLTQRRLKACLTHEVLDSDQPIAVLINNHALSRRDLDLTLTRVRDLPPVPSRSHHDLLRGLSPSPRELSEQFSA